jgi:plastocyanin
VQAVDAPKPAPEAQRVTVLIHGDSSGFYVEPKTIHIHTGDRVTWVRVSGGPHVVAFDSSGMSATAAAALGRDMPKRAWSWLSSPLLVNPGDEYSVTFGDVPPGTYRYACIPHRVIGQTGAVIVDP